MKIINQNINIYIDKGYECKIGDIIPIKVRDISPSSDYIVTLECDNCHKERKDISVVSLNSSKVYKDGAYVCDECYKQILNSRKCDICRSTDGTTNYNNEGVLLCRKHQNHMRRYGKIKRTVNDKNGIRIFDNYAEFDTYDKEGNINCTYKIDLDIVEFIKHNKIYHHKDGYACYKFKDNNGKIKNMRLHRYIMGVADKTNKKIIDHINRDKTDNRRCNLRIATFEDNSRNVDTYSHNTSGYKGVSYDKRRNKWEAYIHQNNKKVGLGLYTTIEKAVQVREIAEIIYFGKQSPRYDELIKKYIDSNEIQEFLLNNKL